MHWMQPANRRIIGQSLNCNEWCCTDCSGVRSTVDAGADCIKSSNQATSWVLQLMAVCQFNSYHPWHAWPLVNIVILDISCKDEIVVGGRELTASPSSIQMQVALKALSLSYKITAVVLQTINTDTEYCTVAFNYKLNN